MQLVVEATGVAHGVAVAVPTPEGGHGRVAVGAHLPEPPVAGQSPALHRVIRPRLESIVAVVVINFDRGDGAADVLRSVRTVGIRSPRTGHVVASVAEGGAAQRHAPARQLIK